MLGRRGLCSAVPFNLVFAQWTSREHLEWTGMDEDATRRAPGSKLRQAQGCAEEPVDLGLLHLPPLHLSAALPYLDFLFSGLQNYVAGVGPGAKSINFVEEPLQPPLATPPHLVLIRALLLL